MPHELNRINYSELNARQRKTHNFQKLSAVLADYGFETLWQSDDGSYADFQAQHVDGETRLSVQLRGRLLFDKKYIGKNITIGFPDDEDWYLYPHDEVLNLVLSETETMTGTKSWEEDGQYHFPSLGSKLTELLSPYRIAGTTAGLSKT